jgi:D-serine deaminase-like pyridoxal phosphate-dependent protein
MRDTVPVNLSGPVLAELETPALLIDLDAMESNIARMAERFKGSGVSLRPHFKNHKCIAIARRQIAAGAIGLTTATVAEAEALVNAGIGSVLLANEVLGSNKIRRWHDLSSRAEVLGAIDHPDAIHAVGDGRLDLLVDVDVGLGRCGVRSQEAALELARVCLHRGHRFRGLMGYEGRASAEQRKTAMNTLAVYRSYVEQHGIPVEIVSGGGTGTYDVADQSISLTEIQPGSYAVMDEEYIAMCPGFAPVLSVLSTVVSANSHGRFILDAGLKSISGEHGMPWLKGIRGVRVTRLTAEHAIVDSATPVSIGDRLEVSVYYSDGTVNLHDRMYGVRGGRVEEVLRIER